MMVPGNLSFVIELKKSPELNPFNTKYPTLKMTVKTTSFKPVIPAESRKIRIMRKRINK
ncbi:MAG TPA: hypothetical protein VMV47_01470 [Bacteroidales bacterium]|nr:hypothetical protein [Bacteroidales bacterium]